MARARMPPRTARPNSLATSHHNRGDIDVRRELWVHDLVNDQLGNPEQSQRQQRSEEARHQSKYHDAGSGLPHDLEHRRGISERRKPLLPAAQETLLLRHA